MVVLVSKTHTFECVLLHFHVVIGADEVDVRLLSELLELLLGGVEVEDLPDAVEVLAHVVLVGVDVQCSVDLILHFRII